MDNNNHLQFIIYACPVGELNTQIETYFIKSRELCGVNSAHKYMPHCTLTGFFSEDVNAIADYIQALDIAYNSAKNKYSLDVAIAKLHLAKDWHGLELQAEGLKQLIRNFATSNPTRQEKLRLKDWLHLSLAYGFNPEHKEQLQNLAREMIDLQADVNWELRFYQKNPDWTWQCLKSWNIT